MICRGAHADCCSGRAPTDGGILLPPAPFGNHEPVFLSPSLAPRVCGIVAFAVEMAFATVAVAQGKGALSSGSGGAASRSDQGAGAFHSERARLEYRAPEECPTEPTFREQVAARVDRAWEASPGAFAREVEVEVTRDDQGFLAQMRFFDASGRWVTRAVRGEDCAEVATGIAIVAALAIESLLAPELPSPPMEEGESTSPAGPPPELSSPASDRSMSIPARTARWRHDVGAGGGVLWGLGPTPAAAVAIRWSTGPVARPPGLQLRLEAADTARTESKLVEEVVDLRFRLLAASLEACPLFVQASRLVSVPTCGGLGAGMVFASGYVGPRLVHAQRAAVPWVAVTAGPRLRLASSRAFAELVPRLQLLLLPWTYSIREPEEVVFDTPRFAGSLAVEAGVRFQ